MKKTCINCKYRDMDYSNEYPCCECNNKSQWEDINHQTTAEDLIILELEKIKAEMEAIKEGYIRGIDYLDIIDDHISELKGE